MTSEDTQDNGNDTPGVCTPGSGRFAATGCPGPEGCPMARSGPTRAAYLAGCRSVAATEANRLYASQSAAKRKRAAGSDDGSAWEDDQADEPGDEPTGELCPTCSLPLYWERGRGAQFCENNHWFNAPGTESRVPSEPERQSAEHQAKPSLADRVAFSVARDEVNTKIDEAIRELDVSEIQSLCIRFGVNPSWDKANAIRYLAAFKALRSETNGAQSYEELNEISEAFNSTRFSAGCMNIILLIDQTYEDIVTRANTIARRDGSGDWYIYKRGTRTIESRNTGASVTISNRAAIEAPAKATRTVRAEVIRDEDEDDYDEDEYDEDEDYIYPSGTGGGIPPGLIVAGLVIVFGIILYVKVPPWWNRDGFLICQCNERHNRPALARFRIDIPGTNVYVEHCGRKRCRQIAKSVMQQYQGETREYALMDSNGITGDDRKNFTGVIKRA